MNYEAFRDLAPFLVAVATVVGGIFAYRAAERQKLKDASSPAMVVKATGHGLAEESVLRDLIQAITLLTGAVTSLIARMEEESEERARARELRFLIEELRRQGGYPEMTTRDRPPR